MIPSHPFQPLDDDGRPPIMTYGQSPSGAFHPTDDGMPIWEGLSQSPSVSFTDQAIRHVRELVRGSSAQEPVLAQAILDPFSDPNLRYPAFIAFILPKIREHHQHGGPLATVPPDPETCIRLYQEAIGWGPAQPFFDQPEVDEIRIFGTDIIVSESGRYPMRTTVTMRDSNDVVFRILQLADAVRVALNTRTPQATIPIPDSRTRIHATIPPRSDAPMIAFRRGRSSVWTLDDLTYTGMVSDAGRDLLDVLIQMGLSILIAGPTSSGKSTVMAALVNHWALRVYPLVRNAIVIEESREMQFDPRAFILRLLVQPSDLSQVLTETLRQTPDLICPYEVRGPEAAAVLSITQTGHQVMTTMHASAPTMALRRLALLATQGGYPNYAAAVHDACMGFPIVIVIDRTPTGYRYLRSITAVTGVSTDGTAEPILVPLYTAEIADDQSLQAHIMVDPNRPETFPPPLHTLRYRLAGQAYVRSAQLASVVVERTLEEVSVLQQTNPVRAFERLQSVWTTTRSMQVLPVAGVLFHRIRAMHPHPFPALHQDQEARLAAFRAAWDDHRWHDALCCYRDIESSLYGYLMLPHHLPDPRDARSSVPITEVRQRLEEYARHVHMATLWLADSARFLDEGAIIRADELIRRIDLRLLPTDLHRQTRLMQYRILCAQGLMDAASILAAELGIAYEVSS
jgi:pilus assembly protein CpaF